MSNINYGVCPTCNARNLDCRQHCWNCGGSLISEDNAQPQIDGATIEALLAQAQVVNFVEKKTERQGWRWPWQARRV